MRLVFLLPCLVLTLLAGCTAAGVPPKPALDTAVAEPAAATVSDQEYLELARALQARSDRKITLAPASSRYPQRLARLMDQHRNEDGGNFSFAVYMTRRVLADAMPTGEIRISIGFMSMLTDNELRFIMGHLMGQVRNGDVLRALRAQYALLDVKKAPAELSAADQDRLLAALEGNQYTAEQENRADDYAYAFMKRNGYDRLSIISVLQKVDRLEKSIKFTASHAESTDRAKRMADKLAADKL